MAVHFCGRIIGPLERQSAAGDVGDETFEFDLGSMDALVEALPGAPIRLEHHPEMEVGNVTAAWRDRTGVYILGVVDAKTMTGCFARKCLGTGGAYYGSLSLAHEHLSYPDGSSRKKPVEVSLCKEPRRPGCVIVWVGTETIPGKYKEASISSKMAEQTPDPELMKQTLVKQETEIQEMAAELAKYKEAATTQEASKGELKAEKEALVEKVALLEAAQQKRDEEEGLKAQALAAAIKQQWEEIGVEVPKQFDQLATSRSSSDSLEFLRLCHQASTRYQTRNTTLANQKTSVEVEKHAEAVDANLNPAKRKRPNVMEVLSKYKSSSGAIGLQRELYNSMRR